MVNVHLYVVNLLIEQDQRHLFKDKHTLNILNAVNGGKEGAVKKMRWIAGLHMDHLNCDMYKSFNVDSWNNKYGDVKNSVTQPMIYYHQAGPFTNHNNFKLREERRGHAAILQ